MDTAKQHYENFLAKHYSWIYGGIENKTREYLDWFKSRDISPLTTGYAVDLGAGSGFQSIPLARLGFKVTAIDTSATLLAELKKSAAGLDINIIEADILDFPKYVQTVPELIVCMGDTLTHLPNLEDVRGVIDNAAKLLTTKGRLAISYRDMSVEVADEARFIPVRNDENRIFTCFLEYQKDYVKVFDIINVKESDGWKQNISHYRKLRISREEMTATLRKAGLCIEYAENNRGLLTFICEKPL